MSDNNLKLGSELFLEAIADEGVEVMFGIPGGVVLPLYDMINKYGHKINHILPKQEQGGGFAADGYARVTGKTGVALGTSGPGATNLLTSITNAMMDSVPVVFITGQVTQDLMGTDAFQETDIIGMSMPVVKHSYFVSHAKDIQRVVKEAFYIANTGRPGPVHIDFAKDAWITKAPYQKELEIDLPGYNPSPETCPDEEIQKLSSLLDQAKKPLVIAGHGVEISGAQNELRTFIEKHNLPTVSTLLGMCTLPHDHPLWLGMTGMHGEAVSNYACHDSDLIISIGSRFDDRITGNLKIFTKDKMFVHIDIDNSEINKNVRVDLALPCDAKEVLTKANQLLPEHSYPDWWQQIEEWKQKYGHLDFTVNPINDETYLSQPRLIKQISDASDGQAIVASDVGRNQMWVGRFYRFKNPNSLLTSGGLGSMGYGLPAAIGAKMGEPNREVWSISGDGGFQMNIQELATIAEHNLDINMVIMEDSHLGMVRQWQNLLYAGNISHTVLKNPDFIKLAEAYGIPAWRAYTYDEAKAAIDHARATSGPALICFMVDPDEHIFPMVPPGASLGEQALKDEDLTK